DLEHTETMIPLPEIYAKLDACPAARKLLLVDACRNDPLASQARALSRFKLESVTRPQTDPIPKTIAAIFSCRPGQQSFSAEKLRHGIFCPQVAKAWEGAADGDPDQGRPADGKITLDELSRFVVSQTAAHSASLGRSQNPVPRNEGEMQWVLRATKDAGGS